jgi:NADPH:quinone reductase
MTSIPSTMRCVEIRAPGKPDVLVPAMRPTPSPGPGEVLIEVAYAGVNRPDVFQRMGAYAPPPGASDLPGLEVSGTVARLGEGVTEWSLGDRVCALVAGGGYATYCTAPAAQCLPVPAGLSMDAAAALPETFFTVWSNVWDRAQLGPGETLLVQGGSSGIGTTAIQLATALGHRVFATAGNAEKCRACERLGAERAIDYRKEDFVAVVKELTGGRGVDVILDMVAGDYVLREIKTLADDGRLVLIAFLGGSKAQVDFNDVMRRRLVITGSTLRPRAVEFKAAIARALRLRVWPLIESGKVAPVMHASFPLDRACDAHTLMESSAHIGKIVLDAHAA